MILILPKGAFVEIHPRNWGVTQPMSHELGELFESINGKDHPSFLADVPHPPRMQSSQLKVDVEIPYLKMVHKPGGDWHPV